MALTHLPRDVAYRLDQARFLLAYRVQQFGFWLLPTAESAYDEPIMRARRWVGGRLIDLAAWRLMPPSPGRFPRPAKRGNRA